MSWAFPKDAREAARFWWLGTPVFLVPLVAPLLWWWQLYFTMDAAMKVLPFAIVAGPVLGWFMIKRTVWLAKAGLHPHYSPAEEISWRKCAVVLLVMVALAWGWALMLLAVVSIPSTAVQERTFTVSDVEHCTRKCLGCPTQVQLSGWVGSGRARLCAASVDPVPRVGDPVRVRGRMDPLVQYVDALEKPRR